MNSSLASLSQGSVSLDEEEEDLVNAKVNNKKVIRKNRF
jgi:hypothetical protein